MTGCAHDACNRSHCSSNNRLVSVPHDAKNDFKRKLEFLTLMYEGTAAEKEEKIKNNLNKRLSICEEHISKWSDKGKPLELHKFATCKKQYLDWKKDIEENGKSTTTTTPRPPRKKIKTIPCNILEEVTPLIDDMIADRRYLHTIAELMYEEIKTSAYILEKLEQIPGIEIKKNLGSKNGEANEIGTGIMAILKGKKKGPTIALRADMDGLPIRENTNLPFSSNTNAMHACGHDGHMAIMLTTIAVLAEQKNNLKGTVKFIFQPAEEGGAGAKRMIRDGCLADVQAIYGLHLWNYLEVGTIGIKTGSVMANSDRFQIEIVGKGGHGSTPQGTVDAIVVGSSIVLDIQRIISRGCDPLTPNVISVGSFNSGSSPNIIAETANITGTVRTMSHENQNSIIEQLQRICKAAEVGFLAKVNLNYVKNYPAVNNDSKCVYNVQIATKKIIKSRNIVEHVTMAGEDFSFYQKEIPGCFFFVGSGVRDSKIIPHHSPEFTIDEQSLAIGCSIMVQLVKDLLF